MNVGIMESKGLVMDCENPLNYNLSKINKVPNRLNKMILSIVIGYNRITCKMLWCELSKKMS
jgi:hypothetical protein